MLTALMSIGSKPEAQEAGELSDYDIGLINVVGPYRYWSGPRYGRQDFRKIAHAHCDRCVDCSSGGGICSRVDEARRPVAAPAKAPSEPASADAVAPVVPTSHPPVPSQPSIPFENPVGKTDPQFVKAKSCASAYREKDTIDRQLKVCEDAESYRNDPQHAEFIRSCDARISKFERRLKSMSLSLASCTAKSPEDAELAFYQAARQAAAAGDTTAQICYMRADFYLGRPWTKEEQAAYDAEAKAYEQAAFDRGDWRVVELLRSATPKVVAQNELMAAITDADRLTIYRMNRLLRRGADNGEYQQLLDALAEDPGMPLPMAEKKKADQWVARIFERQFSRSPRIGEQPDTCITFEEAN